MKDIEHTLFAILNRDLCLSAYELQFPFPKHTTQNGAEVGQLQFGQDPTRTQAFYDLIYHSAILPLSMLPIEELLTLNVTRLLPIPSAPEYPEHCLGLIQILDQSRSLMQGYGFRYTRSCFDPLCERLVRQLIALPAGIRPDCKQAWLSRGYSFEDWIIRVIWFWAPLVHSDTFMTADRERLKDWLHYVRAEVEQHYSVVDPFAALEAPDDEDITVFDRIVQAGPPLKSYISPVGEATIADYAFWWIRILNAHIAITDMCGHYPYKMRYQGLDCTEKDREYMERTDWSRYDPADESVLLQIREDCLNGVWQPLEPNAKFEGPQAGHSR